MNGLCELIEMLSENQREGTDSMNIIDAEDSLELW